jgi:hypothetical protein
LDGGCCQADGGGGKADEKTFLPGDALPKDTELIVDNSAYVTLNEWTTEWSV